MPQQEAKPRASPHSVVIPAEMDDLIVKIYPRAVDRLMIRNGIQDFVVQLQAQGRQAEIPVFYRDELVEMRAELKSLHNGKRRKLFSVVGKIVLAALVILSRWH